MFDLIVSISLLLVFFIIRSIDYIASIKNDNDPYNLALIKKNIMNLVLILFGLISVSIYVISYSYKLYALNKSFIVAISTIVISDIYYLIESNPKLKIKANMSKIIWISIIVISYASLIISQYIASANMYGDESWFTSTFISLLNMEENQVTVGFIAVGTLVLLSGMSTDNKPMMTVGGMFLILIPIYSIINTMINPLTYEYILTTEIYVIFPMPLIAVGIYAILLLGLNSFLIFVPLIFVSMIDKSELK